MFQEVSLNYFKVPSSKYEETQLLAILDCSGSMYNYWQYVAKYYNEIRSKVKLHCAITFDTKVKSIPQADLTNNINTYGGGGTNITVAFLELNKLLYSLKQKKNVTVLFVSDGQGEFSKELIDKTRPAIENLNFICIGVGKNFPTFISMNLRELYHNGDRSIPPLFLVDISDQGIDSIDKRFQIEMLSAAEYMKHQKPIKISPCYQFPWDQITELVWPDSWVSFYSDELETENGKLQKIEVKGEQIGLIAGYWLQNLQLMSLRKKVAQEAQIALTELNKFIFGKKLTFLERVQEQKSALNQIIQELKFLASAQTLQELDEATAAQRLKIGTQIGKYHNKALKFAGVSVEAFQTYKQEFITMIEKTKFVNYDFPVSILSLQNQVDILTDPDLIEGVKNCETQYHLVQSLPIIGYALYVKRSDQSRINPYTVEVLNIAKINKYIDSLAIIDSPNHEVEFNIGDNEKEKFNCLVPLYQHEILIPFLRSSIFHIQMTFVLMENADTCFENAYAALLGNTLLYMICQEENQWKYEMIELINSSFMLAYSDSTKIKYHMDHLLSDPIGTMADENLQTKTQCEDLSKTILMLNQIKNNFKQDQFKMIIQRLVIEAICRITRNHQLFKTVMEVDLQLENEIINKIKSQFTIEELDNIQDFQILKQKIEDKIKTLNIDFNTLICKMEFNKPQFLQIINEQKFNIKTLQSIYRYFLNEELPEELFIIATYHSRIEKSYDRSKKEVEWSLNKIFNELLIEDQIKEKQKSISQTVFDQLKNQCNYLKINNKNKNKNKVQGNRIPRVERRRIRKQKLREQKLLQQQAFQQQQP